MNYFIITTNEQVIICVKTRERSSELICAFSAENALAAILACEAFNNSRLLETQDITTMAAQMTAPSPVCVPTYRSCTHCDNEVDPGIALCRECYQAMRPM